MSLQEIQSYYPSPLNEEVKITADYMVNQLLGESSGHDWWHIYRVWMNTRFLLEAEGILSQSEVVLGQVTALLHDIADHKFHNGNEQIGPETAYIFCLNQLKWNDKNALRVKNIIAKISFKGAALKEEMDDFLGKIVQDADRLDALGAIGIARTFAYGGYAGQPITDPLTPPVLHNNFEAYKASKTSTINHFYEKLLLLEERMNTITAKEIARKRTAFMREFLNQFSSENYIPIS